MTSLMQFRGRIGTQGVRLECYLVAADDPFTPVEQVACPTCQKTHPQLYGFWRKVVGTWGQWCVFRYNGQREVPDLSVPIRLTKLPRDAVRFSPEENARSWHS